MLKIFLYETSIFFNFSNAFADDKLQRRYDSDYTITTAKDHIVISVAGSFLGTFGIDWGDGSPIKKHRIRSPYWAWSENYKPKMSIRTIVNKYLIF
ncbi:MAG: hypothetical protein FWD66_00825 [Paludibacter sp.]|nr:hypothetical protein [Paludibacter sp.]